MKPIRAIHLFFAALLVAALPLLQAQADVVQRIHFKSDAKIIVWGGDMRHDGTLIADHFSTLQKTTARLQHQPLVQTGLLEPVVALAPLDTSTSSEAHFNVASNTGFSIKAELTEHMADTSTLAHTPFHFALSALGPKASAPADGHTQNALTLADLTRPVVLFQSQIATAARPGTIAEQSLTFQSRWGHPAHTGPVDITFTVFMP